MRPARIVLPCPGCGRSLAPDPGMAPSATSCPHCAEAIPLAGGVAREASAPGTCLVCGCPDLYWQKDFPQKIGCLIVIVGAALVPWTWGLSLAVVALVDLALYRALPKVTICYVCRARYRGVPPHPAQAPFDLATAQRREARARSWADGKLRPAFTPDETGRFEEHPPRGGETGSGSAAPETRDPAESPHPDAQVGEDRG